MDMLEQKSAEEGYKHIAVELYKRNMKANAPFGLAVTGIFSSWIPLSIASGRPDRAIVETMMATGFGSSVASDYVMRADYLPPKKDCIARAKDKLSELYAEYKAGKTLIPEGARV